MRVYTGWLSGDVAWNMQVIISLCDQLILNTEVIASSLRSQMVQRYLAQSSLQTRPIFQS